MLLFFLGIAISIAGWFFNKAVYFPWLMKIIAKDCYYGLHALDLLAKDVGASIDYKHPGFKVLLDHWEGLLNRSAVIIIKRGPAFLEFGPQIDSSFALVAYDFNANEIKPAFKESSIRSKLLEIEKDSLLKIGTILFFLGIIITVLSRLRKYR